MSEREVVYQSERFRVVMTNQKSPAARILTGRNVEFMFEVARGTDALGRPSWGPLGVFDGLGDTTRQLLRELAREIHRIKKARS